MINCWYFNSIKVRLERGAAPEYVAKYVTFQFHKGTIRTHDDYASKTTGNAFQFHKGTIRTLNRTLSSLQEHQFQFHKGTIRTLPSEIHLPIVTSISIP